MTSDNLLQKLCRKFSSKRHRGKIVQAAWIMIISPLVFSHEVEVISPDGNRAGHFCAVHSSSENATSDGDVSSEWALLVDISTYRKNMKNKTRWARRTNNKNYTFKMQKSKSKPSYSRHGPQTIQWSQKPSSTILYLWLNKRESRKEAVCLHSYRNKKWIRIRHNLD